MNATLPDLSAKLDPIHRRTLRIVANAAAEIGADWFVAGAMARDWIFTLMHGIDTKRATVDADIAISLAGWEEFERLRARIVASNEFKPNDAPHRLDHIQIQGFHLDLVPFGKLAGEHAEIAWPPESAVVMNVIGFEEACRSALPVRADDSLVVRVASPAGLMLMKLFAWEDRKYLQPTGKDAKDIRLLLTRYENVAGRSLYDVDGLMEAEDFEAERATARLLGRDVGVILSPASRERLLMILDRELAAEEGSLLVDQIACALARKVADANEFRTMRQLLVCFRGGLDD